MRLLIVEDEGGIAGALRQGLSEQGYAVDVARDGEQGRDYALSAPYDVMLLDILLPKLDGLSLLRDLRKRGMTTPILLLPALDAADDRVAGLDAGADDYLVKPFQIDELLARLRAVIRRSEGRVAPVLNWRGIALDPARRTVTRDGEPVRLAAHEYRTLLALMERQGRAVARDLLEDLVYGGQGAIESNTIAVYVHQLRRKLGDDVIATVHGYGYRLGEER